jgi:hypothetical protein
MLYPLQRSLNFADKLFCTVPRTVNIPQHLYIVKKAWHTNQMILKSNDTYAAVEATNQA